MSGLTSSAYEAKRLHNRGAVRSYRGRSGVHVIKVSARDRLYLHQTAVILLLLFYNTSQQILFAASLYTAIISPKQMFSFSANATELYILNECKWAWQSVMIMHNTLCCFVYKHRKTISLPSAFLWFSVRAVAQRVEHCLRIQSCCALGDSVLSLVCFKSLPVLTHIK